MTRSFRRVVPIVAGLTTAVLYAAVMQAQSADTAIAWINGPAVAKLGDVAELNVPAGYRFADSKGARQVLELSENIPTGRELGVLVPSAADSGKFWFTIFEFSPIGYVKDNERDQLDPDKLLEGIRKGNAAANDLRRKKGWATMEIEGWARKPFYDPVTNNLTWAIIGADTYSRRSVNHSVRILGRNGAMEAGLVIKPEGFVDAVAELDTLLTGFRYVEGQRYSEWREGDKVAEYGLTALVAGTAGAVAMKTGLLAKLWKLIVVGVLGLLAAVKRGLSKLWSAVRGEKRDP